ncbi:MAG: DUF1294 domain-containing protein [Oscillospiraceae bacterium]|jgi:uncharacterized membrane protein YsdA (DUF1294 family)|nr:DUF1294 domain-containing protein [Oscillospiraceae bacterium]
MFILAVCLAVVSLLAIGITVFDKRAAKRGARRVPERTLLLVSAVGGSVAMYVTMRLIRHKTKHLKFMLGIPLIIAAQVAVAVLVVWLWL